MPSENLELRSLPLEVETMTPDPSQRSAILAAINAKRLHIITGAAGGL